jgi:hypothetical protein
MGESATDADPAWAPRGGRDFVDGIASLADGGFRKRKSGPGMVCPTRFPFPATALG